MPKNRLYANNKNQNKVFKLRMIKRKENNGKY